jgi:hypothetical protein
MNEKQLIEKATAEGFLLLYNHAFKADFRIDAIAADGEVPDVRCSDPSGNFLNLEITMTEDRDRDIAAQLGRSKHRDFANFGPSQEASGLSGNVFDQIVKRILDKTAKDYGREVALVIRDASGADWDWDMMGGAFAARLRGCRSPFEKGIWIINRSKDRMFRID